MGQLKIRCSEQIDPPAGRIPDGPAPEPLGKERAAAATSGELKDWEGMTDEGGAG